MHDTAAVHILQTEPPTDHAAAARQEQEHSVRGVPRLQGPLRRFVRYISVVYPLHGRWMIILCSLYKILVLRRTTTRAPPPTRTRRTRARARTLVAVGVRGQPSQAGEDHQDAREEQGEARGLPRHIPLGKAGPTG